MSAIDHCPVPECAMMGDCNTRAVGMPEYCQSDDNHALSGGDFCRVPCEPTAAMLNAAQDKVKAGGGMSWNGRTPQMVFAEAWRAMLAASPDSSVVHKTRAEQDVLAERHRQVEAEGWTPELDDCHMNGQLADAAACYAMFAGRDERTNHAFLWPWDEHWWKPKDRRSDLVRAGALILAEIERLDRARLCKGGD